jgi:hypothetical protein
MYINKMQSNELPVRGYHQAVELNPLFYKHKDSIGNSFNISLSNWRARPGRQSDSIKVTRKLSPVYHKEVDVKLTKPI